MARTIIKATFKGEPGSEGYEFGKEYTLCLEHSKIQRTTGSGIVLYGSIQAFLRNWEKIKEVKNK